MQHDELNDDGDSEAIAELERLGVDLTQSQSIEFHIAAPDATTAERIQTELRLRAFTATTYHDEGEPDQDGVIDPNDKTFGPSWTVTTVISMVPTLEELLRVQSQLNDICLPLGGYSDGWGMLYDPTQRTGEEQPDAPNPDVHGFPD